MGMKSFGAGWKAKEKTAEASKNRGWKPAGRTGQEVNKNGQSLEAKKRLSARSSCGKDRALK